jgi:2-polyprenyl-3-methyl-5-hydroxy-6-metoxy-1,4-benzoquinol methylase
MDTAFKKVEKMSELVDIPQSLWSHRLFKDAVSVPSISDTDLAMAICEKKIRLIRNMPSASDESAGSLIAGYSKIIENMVKLIEQAPPPAYGYASLVLRRIRQSIILLKKSFSKEAYEGIVRNLERSLADYGLPPPARERQAAEAIDELEKLYLNFVDRTSRRYPFLARKYWKQIYRVATASLAYNETSDTVRLRPIFKWMIEKMEQHSVKGASYVDVGCAIGAGALNTILAAEAFRKAGLCQIIHGTDVVEPERKMVLEFWRRHRIFLYSANPVWRPLPRQYHIILLANVHRHLTASAQKMLMQHLAQTLYEGGLLFINWRFDKENSPTVCIKKQNASLIIDDEKNTTGLTS